MKQLSFPLTTRLTYSAEGFVPHAGVQDAYAGCESLAAVSGFGIRLVQGAPRTGKTHLCVTLADVYHRFGLFPRLFDGMEFGEKISEGRLVCEHADEVIIVDDVHMYLGTVAPGQSGPFVHFVESARSKGVRVVFTTAWEVERFDCDQHVLSRLREGEGYTLRAPAPEELPELVNALARQRGLRLSDRKAGFLTKRVGRDIPSLERCFARIESLSRTRGGPVSIPLIGDAVWE